MSSKYLQRVIVDGDAVGLNAVSGAANLKNPLTEDVTALFSFML